jgi:hypothetical protein
MNYGGERKALASATFIDISQAPEKAIIFIGIPSRADQAGLFFYMRESSNCDKIRQDEE